MEWKQIVTAAVLGQAAADAVGVPVEFVSREKLHSNPVTDMMGGGIRSFPKGYWSDDTSMLLCTMDSIITQKSIDLDHIMSAFVKWLKEGYMTPGGKPFGIGRTCLHAIANYQNGKDVHHCGGSGIKDNGNGSVMRMLPVSLYLCQNNTPTEQALLQVHQVSALTNGHAIACAACGVYHVIVEELLTSPTKASVKKALLRAEQVYGRWEGNRVFARLYDPNFAQYEESQIKSSGYVVDTLEAALWCLLTTENYKDCVLKAVNLGQDTDTVAAVAGGLAAILHGYESIPQGWIQNLAQKEMILTLCQSFSLL